MYNAETISKYNNSPQNIINVSHLFVFSDRNITWLGLRPVKKNRPKKGKHLRILEPLLWNQNVPAAEDHPNYCTFLCETGSHMLIWRTGPLTNHTFYINIKF